jgi:predicted MFS family arabinose efflux permease
MSGGPWRSLAALTLARAAMGFQFQSVAAVAPLMAGSLGIDKTQLGWLIGLYLLPGVGFALPGGLLGRRYGDQRLVLVGLILMGAGGAWLALARSVPEADLARFVTGAGAVMLNVLMTKMVTDLFDGRERLLAMSVLINAWPIGIGIALLVVGPLGAFAGWRWGLGCAAVFAAIGFVVVVGLYRPPPALPQGGSAGLGLAVLTRREWELVAIAALPWMVYNAAYQIVLSFMPSFLVGEGLGIAHAGSLIALNTVLFVVSVQAGGFVLRRAARPDLVCHLAIVAWCLTMLCVAGGGAPLPWLVLGGLIGGLPAAALVSLPGEFLRPESRNAGMGVFYTVYYFGCAVLPPLAGALYDRAGGQAALWLATGVAFVASLTLALFRRALRVRPLAVRPIDPAV